MIDTGKSRYDHIPIPDSALLDAIEKGLRRGRAEARRKIVRRMAAAAAAVVLVLFSCANVPVLYSCAQGIPLLHAFVQAFRMGEGGADLGPVTTEVEGNVQSVSLSFLKDGEQTDQAPSYSISWSQAPYRLELSFHGIGTFPFGGLKDALKGLDAVADIYETVPPKEQDVSFTIVLKNGYGYELMEFSDPGSLDIRFYPDAYYAEDEYPPKQILYTVRSGAVPYGTELEELLAFYGEEQPSQVKTEEGNFLLVFGTYDTEQEAEAALEKLQGKYTADTKLCLGSVRAGDVPRDEP